MTIPEILDMIDKAKDIVAAIQEAVNNVKSTGQLVTGDASLDELETKLAELVQEMHDLHQQAQNKLRGTPEA